MSKLAPLDSDPSFTSSYLNSLNLFVSDLHRYVDSLGESLSKIFTDATDVSDEITLAAVESISLSLADILYELFYLEARLSYFSLSHLP
ncbi:hypothetical protein LZ757_06445 [Xylella fastidiosa subsp. morus]|uniref:hypothetical protein n=1 Tax=Xylella fastidiosa TaxID=2371 RepID=UPI0004B13D1C|nr:hypothetical protein [Xylella fastidiosa]UIN27749.1 hypothetical protein IUD23_10775 [Xylella fastidiosa subsp. morus]UIN27762.1 hypothetical protein IUD23_10840 [Xylella fastidiosa subsp. morus]UIN27780.1 hypothetical protein IUD23_10930 [Xylella fastidiosa subsp. morus]UIT35707.1 hypothetical protein LZ757_06355 [Xylella fastidiosa subsp. morus]UIT35725.1 hypothetical protein LZ757_06445 [Xylella fastidiosa subsp. morus]